MKLIGKIQVFITWMLKKLVHFTGVGHSLRSVWFSHVFIGCSLHGGWMKMAVKPELDISVIRKCTLVSNLSCTISRFSWLKMMDVSWTTSVPIIRVLCRKNQTVTSPHQLRSKLSTSQCGASGQSYNLLVFIFSGFPGLSSALSC